MGADITAKQLEAREGSSGSGGAVGSWSWILKESLEVAKESGHAPGPGPASVALSHPVPERRVLALLSHSPDVDHWRPKQSRPLAQRMLVDKGRGGPGRNGPEQLVRGSRGSQGSRLLSCSGMVRAQGLRCPRKRKGQQSRPSGQETKVLAPASCLWVRDLGRRMAAPGALLAGERW